MKYLLFAAALIASGALFAQNECNKDHPIYKINDNSRPKTVTHLGADPEFPFLRNLSTPRQVLAAMKSSANRKKYPRQMREMDHMLKQIGFEHGVKSVSLSDISAMNVPSGSTGNMGNGRFRYSYVKLKGGKQRAWKVSAPNGCYVSFLSRCGNAFYAGDNFGATTSRSYTGCKDVSVPVSSEEKEITVGGEGTEHHIIKKTYIYYEKEGCGCRDCDDPNMVYDRSRPLLIKKEDVVEAVPQTYKVTTGGTGTATVCNGKPTNVRADITVEKESEYTGNMPPEPEIKKEYIKVSKHEYKRMMRMMERMP